MARPKKELKKNKEKREIQEEDQLEVNNESNISEKRPRGRPKKEPPVNNIKNEGKKSVIMSQEDYNQYNNYNNGQNVNYTLDGLNDKFKSMFQKYAN